MGPQELIIIGVLAVVMFGKNLPDVAKKLGKTYRDFRKGLSEMQAQFKIDDEPSSSRSAPIYNDDYEEYEMPETPKFEPPTSEPTVEDAGLNESD